MREVQYKITNEQIAKCAINSSWPREFRQQLYDSNNGRCIYCGKKMILGGLERDCMVVEHLISGKNVQDNLVPSCKRCNSVKWSKPIEDVVGFLLYFNEEEQ